MSEIHFTVPSTSPESHDADWQEWNRAIESGFPMERAPEDFIREAEESAFEPESAKNCVECGRSLTGARKVWAEDDVCSGECWAILYGETDMG